MKISLLVTGKTSDKSIYEAYRDYEKRISRYISFETIVIPDLKNARNLDQNQVKEKEGELQLKFIEDLSFVVLLDEKGKEFTSLEFSGFLQHRMNLSVKRITFIFGGPYGFSEKVQARSDMKISLSKMTFSHQLVRLIFAEQLYRAFTILRNEPYHHEG